MEEDEQDASTPFWLQSRRSNTYFRHSSSRSYGGRAASVIAQFFFFAAVILLVTFFIIPPFISSISQIYRPHLVRKSWDYLNLVLVLFAVVCGFLSRGSDNDESNQNKEYNSNDNGTTTSYEYGRSKYSNASSFDRGRRSNSATPRYSYDDQYCGQTAVYKTFSRLRSNSYPDLRLREPDEEGWWRFYDDTRVYDSRFDGPDRIYQIHRKEFKPVVDEGQSFGGVGSDDLKKAEVAVAAIEQEEVAEIKEQLPELTSLPQPSYAVAYPLSAPHPPPESTTATLSPSSKPVKRRTKRVYKDRTPKTDKSKEKAESAAKVPTSPPPLPPLAPPSPPPIVYRTNKKNEKKRSGVTKDFLIALRRKKKKQRQKSVDGLDILFGSDPPPEFSLRLPPLPPPPPPFFHGFFSSKKGKSKRTSYSTSAPSSPPPPPPPPPKRRVESYASTVNSQRATLESRVYKSNQPTKITAFNRRDDVVIDGNTSPLLPIPPPPPPPPFKLPAWKFFKQGDYIRMSSDISFRSGSSEDPDDPEAFQSDDGETPVEAEMVGAESPARMSYPSPDVDTKADNFIARFRAGLKLEKMNSVKEKQTLRRSNLGPGPE